MTIVRRAYQPPPPRMRFMLLALTFVRLLKAVWTDPGVDCSGLRSAAVGVAAARPPLEAGVASGVFLVKSVAGRLGVG